MKLLVLTATFLLCSLLAAPCFAQATGASALGVLRAQLDRQNTYRVEAATDRIRLLDPTSGREILSLRQTSPQTIMLSGVVGKIDRATTAQRLRAEQRIALFNFSSPVGTLTLNERSGQVTMEHALNPRLVPAAAMAHVAALFGEAVQNQGRQLTR